MNNKIIIFSSIVIVLLLIVLNLWLSNSSFYFKDKNTIDGYPTDPILKDMTISVSNGKIISVESSKELPGIIIKIEANDNGRLIIEDPVGNLKKVFSDEPFDEFTIIIDGKEIEYDEISFNIIAFSFEKNSTRIEIVPFLFR